MFRLGCVTILVLLFAIPAVAAYYLPWWGVLLVLIGEVFVLMRAGPALFKYGVKRFFIGIFMTKSRVLRGAKVEIHEVRLTTQPVRRRQLDSQAGMTEEGRTEITAADGTVITTPVEDEYAGEEGEEAEDEDTDATSATDRFVLVDFSLMPVPGASRMQLYEPSELLLVPADAKIDLTEDPTSDGVSGSVYDLTLVEDSGAENKDVDKLSGPARLRIIFRSPEMLKGRVKFRYYFEAFGNFTLPD